MKDGKKVIIIIVVVAVLVFFILGFLRKAPGNQPPGGQPQPPAQYSDNSQNGNE